MKVDLATKSRHPVITPLPSPENSNLNPVFPDQVLIEFLGEGLGVRETEIDSSYMYSIANRLGLSSQHSRITRPEMHNRCPSPPAPHPREIGKRLISKQRVEVRILGERGAS
jgi:hypothetical protein